ncbi:hypothetical protein D3C72_349440 [compost metagenome]
MRVVGQLTAGQVGHGADVIDHRQQHRERRGGEVNGQDKRCGWIAVVPCRIGGLGDQIMRAFAKRSGQGHRPVPAGVRRGGAAQCTAFIDIDGCVRLTGPTQTRQGVIRCLPAAQWTGHGADIVQGLGDNRGERSDGIHNHREARRCHADVARRIGRGGRPGMAAIAQGGWRGEAPCSRSVGRYRANLHAVFIDDDGGIGRRRSVQLWPRVVGRFAV